MRIHFDTSGKELLSERRMYKKIEYAQMKSQLRMFSTFLPNYILDNNELEDVPFVGVVLQVRTSGMHKLIEKYNKFHDGGIYKLTATLNTYLGIIIETVTYWGGDVIKIYGDSCLNLWKVEVDEALYDILHLVVICSSIIRESLLNFETGISQKLKLRIAVACGNLRLSTYGKDVKFVMLQGEAMIRLNKLMNDTKHGDIFISSRSWAHMTQERYQIMMIDKGVKLISDRFNYKRAESEVEAYFESRLYDIRCLIKKHLDYMQVLHSTRQIDTNNVFSKLQKEFISAIPTRPAVLQAPRRCNLNMLRSFVCRKVQTHVDGNEPVEYLTEITTLTVQVILIKPNFSQFISNSFVRDIFREVEKTIVDINAFLYKFEVQSDIKIVVLNGLHGNRQDVESQRALRSGYVLNQHFEQMAGVDYSTIGVFQGYFYCGVLGHPLRKDYTILSPILMQAFNAIEHIQGKVICDYKTFKFSKLSSFYFRCIGTRKCRLQFDDGQRLIYDENIEVDRSTLVPQEEEEVFGRNVEIDLILSTLESEKNGGLGLVITGNSKMGKSILLRFALRRVTKSDHFTLASLTLDEFSTTPYFVISKIYRQLYDKNTRLYGNISTVFTLPSNLLDSLDDINEDDDIALVKYRILNSFRDMIEFGSDRTCLIVIDNIQYIDISSWEVLDIVLITSSVRCLFAGHFKRFSEIKNNIMSNENLMCYKLKSLSRYWINTIACQLLGVAALSTRLSLLLANTCLGRPGYVPDCLNYFINSDYLIIKQECKENISADYKKIDDRIFFKLPDTVRIMTTPEHFQDNRNSNIAVTIASITNEFFKSLDLFEQRILKTAAALGTIFTRNMLIVTLHYPDFELLLKAIQNLFEKGVFDCGSTFVNGDPILVSRLCCHCYMSEDELFEMGNNERYKYCKLLHFRNENIKSVAYGLIPVNQKKDLHLKCTDVLEQTLHLCPRCIRDPINSFMVTTKFNEILEYCNDATFKSTRCGSENYEKLRDSVRRTFRGITEKKKVEVKPLRDVFDPTQCSCFDINIFVYKQLIHHSTHAKHLGKRIFFFTQYGKMLILIKNIVQAIEVLREARELCFNDADRPDCEITESFRKYHVGKISCALASAFIILRKMNEAKFNMAIALRQYNVPSLVFNFMHFRMFLKKIYLVNQRSYHPIALKCTWMHWEIGMCMIVCAKIFATEGNWSYAKYCSAYSIWILRQMNDNIPMLFDAYCSTIDLYRYGLDREVCEKLQKYVTKEVLLNYSNNRGFYVRHLIHLMNIEFELRVTSGKLNKAVQMIYRIIDVTMKVYIFVTQYELVNWLGILFTYTMRFKDFSDLMQVIGKNIREDSQVWYYSNALSLSLHTGYSLIPIDTVLKYIYKYLTYKPQERLNWEENYLLSLLHLHLLKSEAFIVAEKFKPNCPFNSATLRKPIAMRVLLNMIEATIIDMFQKKKRRSSLGRLDTNLNRLLVLAKSYINNLKIMLPRFYCLSAWKHQLLGNTKKAKKQLAIAERISKEHENNYHLCLVRQLRNHWKGNQIAFSYRSRVAIDLKEVMNFTKDQWSQVLFPFPDCNY